MTSIHFIGTMLRGAFFHYYYFMQTGFKNWSLENYRSLKTALWFSGFFPHSWPISFTFCSVPPSHSQFLFLSVCVFCQTVGNTVSVERLLLLHISLRIHFINHIADRSFCNMDGTRGKKNIIFIIKSVLLHERTIKWPINFSLFPPLSQRIFFLCSLPIYFLPCKVNDKKIYSPLYR